MSIADESLRLTGLFEAELLTELMLRYWNHPRADEPAFRANLLESAAEILQMAVTGTSLIEDMKPENTNLVVALWCAEVNALDGRQEDSVAVFEERRKWTETIRRALPSCFCDPDLLP
jgi:hypothetical protein